MPFLATGRGLAATEVILGIGSMPTASFGAPYRGAFNGISAVNIDGTISAGNIATANTTLSAALAVSPPILMETNLTFTRSGYQNLTTDAFADASALVGSLNVPSYKARLDAFKANVTIPPSLYPLLINDILDEPQDSGGAGGLGNKSGWGGFDGTTDHPVPYADALAVAAYAKKLYPQIPTGFQTTTAYLLGAPGGGAYWKGALDYIITNYNWKNGVTADPTVWYPPLAADAATLGLPLLVNINCTTGGAAQTPVGSANVDAWARYFLAQPSMAGLILFTWANVGGQQIIWNDANYGPVLNNLIPIAQARRRTGKVGIA